LYVSRISSTQANDSDTDRSFVECRRSIVSHQWRLPLLPPRWPGPPGRGCGCGCGCGGCGCYTTTDITPIYTVSQKKLSQCYFLN